MSTIFAITPTVVTVDFHLNENHRYCYCTGRADVFSRARLRENGLNQCDKPMLERKNDRERAGLTERRL